MNTAIPPVSSRQLPEFRESLSKWASDIWHRRKPSGLATDLSRAQAAATSEPLDDRSLYVDLANLRGLSAGVQNLGGALVPVERAEIVQAFFPVSAVTQAGAVFETHSGNLAVPRQVTTETASWLAETDTVTESTVLLGQATAQPKRASVLLSYTRQLNVQSDVGAFVQSNGLKALGAAVDKACLTGSGIFGEPTGLLSMAGTSSVTFSASATWANALSFVYNCETANVATEDISFIAAPNVKQKWMNIQQFSGSSDAIWESDGATIAGRPARVTTNMSAGAIVAGGFNQVRVILFGPAQVTVDPYSQKRSEKIEVTLTQLADVIVPFPGAFCVSSGNAAQ
jgi:HK97 family phage major capsid protein